MLPTSTGNLQILEEAGAKGNWYWHLSHPGRAGRGRSGVVSRRVDSGQERNSSQPTA